MVSPSREMTIVSKHGVKVTAFPCLFTASMFAVMTSGSTYGRTPSCRRTMVSGASPPASAALSPA